MRVKEIALKNFRGFKDLKIQFPDSKVLVFVGINGAGKSSILDCIAMFLSQFITQLSQKNSRDNRFTITENDIHIEATETINTITMEGLLDDHLLSSSDNTFSWPIEKNRSPLKRRPKEKTNALLAYTERLYEMIRQNPDLNLPVLAYYQNHRIFFDHPAKPKSFPLELPQLYAYENAFKKGIHDFDDFVTWFRLEEDWENEKKIEKGLDFINKNLEVVRTAIQTFLFRLPAADFSHLRVVRTKTDGPFRFEASIESSLVIEKTGKSLKIEQLSDGEKMLLLVVGDLARRLSIANPSLENVLLGNGIVLIDEVDLHLHPQWQREVIPALTAVFPHCQFIVSTHSPLVLSNVAKENVAILENNQVVENTPHTYGKDSNSILYESMNVEERPTGIKQELDRLYRLIDDEKTGDARIEIKRLAKILGENDKDIVRANMIADFQDV